MVKSSKEKGTAEQPQQQAAADGGGERQGGKKRRHRPKKQAAEGEQLRLPQDELARRERQRKMRDLALRLRAEGKVYKKHRKHKPRRKVQLIIVPVFWNKRASEKTAVLAAADRVQELLRGLGVKCDSDTTDTLTPGQKFRSWEEKGVMLRVELGPKEATEGTCILARCRTAGEVADKVTVAVGPALCQRVKQQLEEMGHVLVPPAAAAAAGAAAGAAAEDVEEQEGEEVPAKQAKKGAAEQAEQAGQQPAVAAAQQQQRGSKASAEELEGDFAGVALLQEQGPGKKGTKKAAAAAVAADEVAAFQDLGEGGGSGKKKGKKQQHKVVAF